MKKLSDFGFVVLLMISLCIVIWCFQYADNFRGYNATGGEMITFLLPLTVAKWKLWTMEQERKAYKEKIERYKSLAK